MASPTFHLVSVNHPADFLAALRSLSAQSRPLYVGETVHWIHEPELSAAALTGTDPASTAWNYLVVAPSHGADGLALPTGIDASLVARKWSITAPADLEGYNPLHNRRPTPTAPPLPAGWSAADHSGLSASEPPSDLAASLALRSRRLGGKEPVGLKDFIAAFGSKHTGPVAMFNLLSYMPDGGQQQYYGYVQAFRESIGKKYGGGPLFFAPGVTDWSSRADPSEQGQEGGWVDLALVWYPSLWHFGKMLDDPGYAEVDRKFKQGAIRDNPLICCTEVDVGYVD